MNKRIIDLSTEEFTQLLEEVVKRNLPKYLNIQPVNKEMISLKEACELLNLKSPTIYGMVSKDRIPFHKPAGTKKLYFSRQELNDWLTKKWKKRNKK